MKVKMRVMMSQVTSRRCSRHHSRRHSRRAQHEELDLLGAQPVEMKEEPGSQLRSDPCDPACRSLLRPRCRREVCLRRPSHLRICPYQVCRHQACHRACPQASGPIHFMPVVYRAPSTCQALATLTRLAPWAVTAAEPPDGINPAS